MISSEPKCFIFRVEKTEALTSDLQVLEKRVEQYGKIFSTTGKKLLSCLQGQPGQDVEKRQVSCSVLCLRGGGVIMLSQHFYVYNFQFSYELCKAYTRHLVRDLLSVLIFFYWSIYHKL